MSAETLQAVEDALQAHLSDIRPDENELVTAWSAIVAYTTIENIDTDRTHGYKTIQPTNMAFHEVAGLFHIAELAVQETWMDND